MNDRPYAATSLLSVAPGQGLRFGADRDVSRASGPGGSAHPVEVTIAALPSEDGADLIRRLFEPLGYLVEVTAEPLDLTFPIWGESRNHHVRLAITARLSDVLTHLTGLIRQSVNVR